MSGKALLNVKYIGRVGRKRIIAGWQSKAHNKGLYDNLCYYFAPY